MAIRVYSQITQRRNHYTPSLPIRFTDLPGSLRESIRILIVTSSITPCLSLILLYPLANPIERDHSLITHLVTTTSVGCFGLHWCGLCGRARLRGTTIMAARCVITIIATDITKIFSPVQVWFYARFFFYSYNYYYYNDCYCNIYFFWNYKYFVIYVE
ncbi:hypothetical protein AA313_de0202571 [Arthrobotrys entomopaga]|nr:hypothetical protein AA313_de0202571 [Arthrobotrys entomopaga]